MLSQWTQCDGDAFPWELVTEQISHLENEKAGLTAIIAELDMRLAEKRTAVTRLEALTAYLDRVDQNLSSFGFEEKRLALEALGFRVYANGRDWRAECFIPFAIDGGVLQPTSLLSAPRPPSPASQVA